MTCFRDSLKVTLVLYITFLTKQWCKLLERGHDISGKEGPAATASLSFLISIPARMFCWQSICD